MAHEHHRQKTKQHALRRDVHRRYPLWVYDDDDWRLMHGDNKLPVGDLICPADGCRAELVAVEVEKTGTRFLRNRRGTSDCGHAFGRAQGGGPPSPEHRWFQQRLAMLCSDLGYEAIQEHYESNSDVWVEGTRPLSIEVQKWPTTFNDRSEARQSKGAKVLWLLPESASSKKVGKELFRQPAARIRVFKRGSQTEEVRPWEPGGAGRVILRVGATVLEPSKNGLTLLSAGNYDAKSFLREVLEGEREWYGPNEKGFKYGSGWARPDDVEQVRAARRRASKARADATRSSAIVSPATEEPKAAPEKFQAQMPDRLHSEPPEDPPDVTDTEPTKEARVEPETDLSAEQIVDTPEPTGWFQRLRKWFMREKSD